MKEEHQAEALAETKINDITKVSIFPQGRMIPLFMEEKL